MIPYNSVCPLRAMSAYFRVANTLGNACPPTTQAHTRPVSPRPQHRAARARGPPRGAATYTLVHTLVPLPRLPLAVAVALLNALRALLHLPLEPAARLLLALGALRGQRVHCLRRRRLRAAARAPSTRSIRTRAAADTAAAAAEAAAAAAAPRQLLRGGPQHAAPRVSPRAAPSAALAPSRARR